MAARDLTEWDREIEADFQRAVAATRAAGKRKKEGEPFAMVPLRCAEEMAKASKSPAVIICIRLLYLSWRAKSPTVTLSNRECVHHRNSKDRVLRNLEAAGLVRVERRCGHSPRVTILRRLPWCRPAPT
jgi:hypothetical protein